MTEAIVGFEEETKELIQQLINSHRKHLHVVSLVGMPGIGKTTLARRLYTDNDIIKRFDVLSWCTVSEVYDRRKTLLELLDNLVSLDDDIRSNADDDELADQLRRHLLRKRYLIVLDDLWSTDAWDDLQGCFPDDGNSCSRLIMTTRQESVASCTQISSDPYQLRSFTYEESWFLLKKKVFGEETCPPQLEKIGVKIAQRCKGLPLAIVLVAGLLANLDKEESRWKGVANGLRHLYTTDGDAHLNKIIEKSFRVLPQQLKLCFLYFGEYFGNEVKVRELIQRWVAEELAVGNGSKSAEDVAKDNLMILIKSNLVVIARRSLISSKVITVSMHDLLRDFCSTKCRELWESVPETGGSDESSSAHPQSDYEIHLLDHLERGSIASPITYRLHSLLTHLPPSDDIFYQRDLLFDCEYMLSHELCTLRVLDLECVTVSSTSPIAFQSLIHLRYLALKGNFEELPSWLSQLKNLETLIIRESHNGINLSQAIWGMESLNHLQVTGKPAIISCHVPEFDMYQPLVNLKWISFAHLPGGAEFQRFASKVPNLVKLRCWVDEPQPGDQRCIKLQGLHSLNKLESLKVYFPRRGAKRLKVQFPMNLKKLTLSSCQLPWSDISTIGRLENLEVLKLESNAFQGKQWNVKDEEFQNLKLLKLYNMDIPKWSFSEDMSFKNLQQVTFRNSKVQTIPINFEYLDSLKKIEVCWCKCSRSALNSLMQIKETQTKDMGKHDFKLIIKSRDEESESDDEEEEELGLFDSELLIFRRFLCFVLLFFIISVPVKWADLDLIQ